MDTGTFRRKAVFNVRTYSSYDIFSFDENRRWDQVERNIEEIDKIFFDYDKERILNTPPEFFVEQIQKIKVNGRTVLSMLS